MTQTQTHARTQRRAPRHQQSLAARRAGYVIGALVNVVMLGAVNVWPGWQAVPFLTDDMTRVLGLVNASIAVGVLVNLAYIVSDRPLVKAVGDIAQPVVGIAALVRMWQVFPFDFEPGSLDWELLARWAIAVGVAGSVIAIIVAVVGFARALLRAT